MVPELSRRTFLQQASLVSAGLVLAACAPVARRADDDADEAKDVTVTMWGGAFLMNANQNIFDNSSFKEAKPHISLEATPASGNQYAQKMRVAIAAGDPEPDVMLVHYRFVKDFLTPDITIDLTGRVDASNFSPDIFKSVREEGKIYGIPYETATFVNYHREDVLSDLGLDLPMTRDEYFTVGATVKEQTGANWTFLDKASGNEQLYLAILLMLEGDIFSSEDGSVVLDQDDRGVEAAQLLMDISQSGFASPLRFDSPEGFEEVKNGETVGNLTPYAWIHRMMDALTPEDEVFGKWRIGQAPTLQAGGSSAVSHNGAYLAVNKLSRHVDAAWDVAKFFGHSIEGVVALSEQFVIIGAYKPGLEKVKEISQGWDIFGGQRAQAQMADVALDPNLRVITMHPNMAEAQSLLAEGLNRMINEEITPEELITDVAGKVRNIDKG